jgi:hypothetical protein
VNRPDSQLDYLTVVDGFVAIQMAKIPEKSHEQISALAMYG